MLQQFVASIARSCGASAFLPAGVALESLGIGVRAAASPTGPVLKDCNCSGHIDDCRALIDLYAQNPDHPAYQNWCRTESSDLCTWTDEEAVDVYIRCMSLPASGVGLQAPTRRVTSLRVRNQAIPGTMPESLGMISELVELDFSNNLFFGAVPASLASLSKLQVLDLEGNSLSSLPSSLCTKLSDESLDCDLRRNAFEHSPDCASRCRLDRQGLDIKVIQLLVLAAFCLVLVGVVMYVIKSRMKKIAARGPMHEIPSSRPSIDTPAGSISAGSSKQPWATSTLMSITTPLTTVGHNNKPPSPRQEWFSSLFGFSEASYAETKRWLRVTSGSSGDGGILESVVNGATYQVGSFQVPTLRELREAGAAVRLDGTLTLTYRVGDCSEMHASPENKLATFQVESQFNCLEFAGPNMSPEDGVTGYMNDRGQGCACSIACGPAAVFRNYFVHVRPGDLGQSHDRMINNLADLSDAIGNVPEGKFFRVQGGYVVAAEAEFRSLAAHLQELEAAGQSDVVRGAVRVGVQEGAQVTATSWGSRPVADETQVVTQVLCGFARAQGCEALASLVLEASYEAALWVGLRAAEQHRGAHGSRRVFLSTFGGACSTSLVATALERACGRFRASGLEVVIVGSRPEPELEELARRVPRDE